MYATRSARPGERVWKGRRLYNERIYFDGNSVKEIYVDGRGEIVLVVLAAPDKRDIVRIVNMIE